MSASECACQCAGMLFISSSFFGIAKQLFDLLCCNKIKMRPPYFWMRKVKLAKIAFYGVLTLLTVQQPFGRISFPIESITIVQMASIYWNFQLHLHLWQQFTTRSYRIYHIYKQKIKPYYNFRPSKYHMEVISNVIESNGSTAKRTTHNRTNMFSLRTSIVYTGRIWNGTMFATIG